MIGLGVGVASCVPPVLLSEIATPATRGIITTVHQLALTFGIFVVALIGYGLVTFVQHGWQYVQAISILPSLLMLINYQHIPESPKWLLSQRYETITTTTHNTLTQPTSSTSIRTHGLNPEVYEKVYATLKALRHAGYNIDEEI